MIKLINILKEIKIRRPSRMWDLTKYTKNFNPNEIKVGDTIKIKPKRRNPELNSDTFSFEVEDILKTDLFGIFDPQGEVLNFMFNNKKNSYTNNQLEWFNNKNLENS
jgi:hypothetical protein